MSLLGVRVQRELHEFVRVTRCEEVEAVIVRGERHMCTHRELPFLSR